MATTTTIVLRKKTNCKGLYPLAIRISKNRSSTYHYIGYNIKLKEWDDRNKCVRKSHPNSDELNGLLSSRLAAVRKGLIELQTENKDLSVKFLKKKVYTNTSKSFFEVAKEFLNELENSGKISRWSSDKARVRHLENFVGTKNLSFAEIDETLLRNFMVYLKNKSVSHRSVVNNLVVIRTIFNRGIRMGYADRRFYPFGAGKISIKFPESQKIGLTTEEIRKLESLEDLSYYEQHSRNIWLFSFYLAGIRIGDVLKMRWSNIIDGRIYYRMNKNSKLLSLRIPEKIYPILDFYRTQKRGEDDFIFPELKYCDKKNPKDIYTKNKTATRRINNALKLLAEKAEISKKLTMHIARHSFGNISGDKIPIQMLQKLYRHSSVTTTIQYQSNFIQKDADDALDKVINF